jgi:hypothetical protein
MSDCNGNQCILTSVECPAAAAAFSFRRLNDLLVLGSFCLLPLQMSARSDAPTGSITLKFGINKGNTVPQNEFFQDFATKGVPSLEFWGQRLLFARCRHERILLIDNVIVQHLPSLIPHMNMHKVHVWPRQPYFC